MEMRRKIAAVGICSLGLLAIGSAPRYLEELRIGGGYGDAANGGADFDKSGNIATDGCIQAAGGVESGKDSAARGVVTAWDGSGGNAPGALRLGTANGGIGFVFMADDRSGLRISGVLPASDADGEWLKDAFPVLVPDMLSCFKLIIALPTHSETVQRNS